MTASDTADGTALPDSDATRPPPADAYSVPAEADATRCPDCDRPFPGERELTLHRGLEHGTAVDDAGGDVIRDARDTEDEQLRLFRLKAIAVLVLLYFGLLMVYAVVL